MYKKQMTVQKVICLLTLVASVLAFVYSLGMMTDLHDTLSPASTHVAWAKKQSDVKARYEAMAAENATGETAVEETSGKSKGFTIPAEEDFGFSILKDMQPFNRDLLMVSIGLILLACLLFLTNTASRRKYYIANYISTGLCAAANVATAIWAAIQVEAFRVQYYAMDHETLAKIMTEKVMRSNKSYVYEPSATWFNLYYVVFAALLLVSILLIVNVIWKNQLMKEEKRLIDEGKAAAA